MKFDRQAWIDSLKVGDEVATCSFRSYMLHKVTARTPSGRIRFGKHGAEADKLGRIRGRSASAWSASQIEFPTDDIREAIERNEICGKLKSMNWDSCSTDTLRKVKVAIGLVVKQDVVE